MRRTRRSLLRAGATATGVGFAGCQQFSGGCPDEIACFSFEYQGADDIASRLDIEHAGGERRLRAGEVYVTGVSVDYESGDTDTVAWAELDDAVGPSDTIDGAGIRIPLGPVDIVEILWRGDGDERVIEAWVYDDDATSPLPPNTGFGPTEPNELPVKGSPPAVGRAIHPIRRSGPITRAPRARTRRPRRAPRGRGRR